jgi:pimeloyl-ACP methyl ester carboxylesterase
MLGNPFGAYLVDSWQRAILFADVMRQRGNQFIEHYQAGKPPVLVFEHDVVLDGADLGRPCNYVLLRIKPDRDVPTDPKKRPFVVFDPRAGHGPGIGGSKEASQVGVALRAGHPVYFVSFRPEPVEGQTLADVAHAEWHFLEKVRELHPEAEAKPAIVGNCQAGWAIMILSAYAPDQASVIGISGSPLSYWAGVEGKNPLRYLGGLTGGNWPASLASDLGAGIFDGIHLVGNFENLNPANTYVGKPYNLYKKIDTEPERYLGFERWWGGYFMLTQEEMEQITSELFVGNKLTEGKLVAPDGTRIDLRQIRAPIVVVCSEGDNITPPPQALNWIIDLYESVDEIRANEQTIVYTVHPTVGHLGIFVSAKVALKEHAEFVDSLDLIETLAPGLYEMVIEEEHIEAKGKPAEHTAYNVRFVARSFEDILAYDDGREDEAPFRTLAKVSETNQGLYRQLVSPWVRAMVTPQVAEAMRLMHPLRQAQIWASDFNPWMAGIKWAAEQVRENRQALPADDAFRATEEAIVKRTEEAIEAWTEARDRMVEQLFKATWNQPWIRALVGEEASFADVRKPRARRDKAFRELAALKLRALGARESKGSFAEAIMRVVYAATKAAGGVDARAYVAAREIWRRHPRLLAKLDRRSFLAEAKEAALMVAFDEEQALASLPQLLPTAEERREAVDLLRQMAAWRAEMMPEIESLLDRVEAILAVAPAAGKVASEPVNAAALEVAAEPESSEARPAETPATVPAAAPTTAKEKVVAVPRRTPDPRRPSARRTNKTTS